MYIIYLLSYTSEKSVMVFSLSLRSPASEYEASTFDFIPSISVGHSTPTLSFVNSLDSHNESACKLPHWERLNKILLLAGDRMKHRPVYFVLKPFNTGRQNGRCFILRLPSELETS